MLEYQFLLNEYILFLVFEPLCLAFFCLGKYITVEVYVVILWFLFKSKVGFGRRKYFFNEPSVTQVNTQTHLNYRYLMGRNKI